MMRLRHITLGLLGFVTLSPVHVHAQVTAAPSQMTFQGRLTTPSGNPVPDGTYSIRFSLWDALSAGTEKWNQTLASVQVKNGTFAVPLSGFPATTFDGNLYLETKIGTDTPLTPRQAMLSVPYAMKSNIALTVPDGSLTASKFASGALNSAVNSLAWILGGNSGTNPASQFLGTTDAQPLVFRTNNAERMRLLANGNLGIGTLTPIARLDIRGGENPVGTPAFIVGGLNGTQGQRAIAGLYSTFPNVPGDTIARRTADLVAGFNGGAWGTEYLSFHVGNNGAPNDPAALTSEKLRIMGNGNIGIGTSTPTAKLDVNGTTQMTGFKLLTGAGVNKVLTSDAAGVGTWNVLTSLLGNNSITDSMIQNVDWSKITNTPSGGWNLTGNVGINPASNFMGTLDEQPLVFKVNNRRAMQYEYVSTSEFESVNVVGGSPINSLGLYVKGVTIAGGGQDNVSGTDFPNRVLANFGTVGGGRGNVAQGEATVAGGRQNTSNFFAAIGGGTENNAGYSATIGGGYQNNASGQDTVIGGGYQNSATSRFATVGGGVINNASGERSTLAGGQSNTSSGYAAAIGGGVGNTASGDYAVVPGGSSNTAAGSSSFAAGRQAKANHMGAFVWADASNNAEFASTAEYQFNIRAAGGTRIFSNAETTTGVLLAAGGGSWSTASDRSLKTNFQSVDTLNVLEKLISMPLTTWNYKANADIRHMGVMAQDFYAAFGGLGLDDKHIDTVDADGVAFAAIQGLNRKLEIKVKGLQSEVTGLKAENTELKARMEALETAVQRLIAQPK